MAQVTIKAIKPKGFDERAFRRVIADALGDIEKGVLKDFEETTETWKHQVKFEHGISITARQARAFVETMDEIYRYVNDGTRPHRIPKTGNANLRFKWGGKGSYRAKTKPGRLGSRPGGPNGPVVHRAWVQHPGTDPRKFDEQLAKRWRGLIPRALNSAMSDAVKASGHAVP
jgi:hypothetical protein